MRQYPDGPLYAGITGFDSALNFGTTGIEQEYDGYLSAHQEDPQTLSQLLFREKLPQTTDNVTLSIRAATPAADLELPDHVAARGEQRRGRCRHAAVDRKHPGHGVETDV